MFVAMFFFWLNTNAEKKNQLTKGTKTLTKQLFVEDAVFPGSHEPVGAICQTGIKESN